MEDAELRQKVFDVIRGINEDILDYTGDNMLADDITDSFELVELVLALGKAFKIKIDPTYAVAVQFANKDTIVALMTKLVGEAQ